MVIGLPGRVGVAHPADRLLIAFPVGLHGIADLVLLFRIQEDIDQVGKIPEDIVRPPPYNDAGPLLRDLANGLGLGQNCLVIGGGRAAGEKPVEEGFSALMLLGPPDHLLRKACLFRCQLNDFLVIVGNPQQIGNSFGHTSAPGPVFPADGNDMLPLSHRVTSSPACAGYRQL